MISFMKKRYDAWDYCVASFYELLEVLDGDNQFGDSVEVQVFDAMLFNTDPDKRKAKLKEVSDMMLERTGYDIISECEGFYTRMKWCISDKVLLFCCRKVSIEHEDEIPVVYNEIFMATEDATLGVEMKLRFF